ncbi:MAG: NAD+ synthase [Phycisphaerae bacterium]|nr:NAD+ synthase [Phycisphaerae bacterium]
MKIALAQFNPVVGDITGNVRRMGEWIRRAANEGAELVVFGELSVVGYPPRDLLRKDGFVAQAVKAVEELAKQCTDIAALVGYVRPTPNGTGRSLQNVAGLLADGQVRHVHVKTLLPTYDVFDEMRYFEPGREPSCIEWKAKRLGLSICEDLWDAESLGRELYGRNPIADLAEAGADIVINLAASPYEFGKATRREELFRRQSDRRRLPIVYVNQVGGNDELIFDGCSSVVTPGGKLLGRARSFEEDLLVVDLDAPAARCEPLGEPMERLSKALKLGLRDYVRKCGFQRVVLGLSGGIDSAVVATLAADALGPQNVTTLAMPSRYSSDHSLADAMALAKTLCINHHEIPIETMHAAYETMLREKFSWGGEANDIAAENIQARIRGNIVMAWSNAFGNLALATGNKSELSVGYCTLYGDMCGGLAPIGDVLKTQVYALAKQLNAEGDLGPRIPRSTLKKPPSAELKPGQVDQDKLPPYEILDEILFQYVEQDRTVREITRTADGEALDAELVARIVRMVDLSEYKRQQAARVLKVSSRAFGMGRRMPIAQGFIFA